MDCKKQHRVEKWLNGEITGTGKFGEAADWVRRWVIERDGEKCSVCGWAEKHPITGNVVIELDHVDGDSDNNRPENLRFLCPNHHALTPTYRSLNSGKSRRTWRKKNGGMPE